MESLNGTTGHPIVYDVRIKRIKRGVYGIEGTLLITESFDDYTVKTNGVCLNRGNNVAL